MDCQGKLNKTDISSGWLGFSVHHFKMSYSFYDWKLEVGWSPARHLFLPLLRLCICIPWREHRSCPFSYPAARRGDIGTRGLSIPRALVLSTGLVLFAVMVMSTVMVEAAG
jgi:hypothetical protein